MKWTAITRHRAGTTFVLVFFLVFLVLGSVLALEAVRRPTIWWLPIPGM